MDDVADVGNGVDDGDGFSGVDGGCDYVGYVLCSEGLILM